MTLPEWQLRAYCATGPEDADTWFEDIALARHLCRTRCPVTIDCLFFAIDLEREGVDLPGIWGGLGQYQRWRMRASWGERVPARGA